MRIAFESQTLSTHSGSGGKSMARSTAENHSSLTLGYTFFSVYYILDCRTSGNRTSNRLYWYCESGSTVRFAPKRPLLLLVYCMMVDLEVLSSATLLTHSCESRSTGRHSREERVRSDESAVVLTSLALKLRK